MRDQRVSVWEKAKAIAETAAEENRALEADEQRQWDEANAEMKALDTRINSYLEGEKRAQDQESKLAALDGSRSNGQSGTSTATPAPGAPGSLSARNAELRSWARG